MNRLSKTKVLQRTENGKKLFQLMLPGLKIIDGKCMQNVDSPLSKGKGTLSVFANNKSGIYNFKDHYNGLRGDIFEYVARLHKLDSKVDFKRVLEIISEIMVENVENINYDEVEAYRNNSDTTTLILANKHNSNVFISKNYLPNLPFIDSLPKYEMRLVESCSYINEGGERRFYNFDYSLPQEAFYSLTIENGKFYILFNPFKRKCYSWGQPGEFYVVGQENLFSLAYHQNVLLNDTIVLTNSIIGLLFLQDKGIPSIAVLNGETELPEFFTKKVLSQFPNRYFLGDIGSRFNEQIRSFTSDYQFEFLRTGENYLISFFKNNKHPEDTLLEKFEFSTEYEYEARRSEVEYLF